MKRVPPRRRESLSRPSFRSSVARLRPHFKELPPLGATKRPSRLIAPEERSVTESADAGFRALMDKITRDRGFRCSSYKDKCLRRRVGVRMRARGAASYRDYAKILDSDSHEYD